MSCPDNTAEIEAVETDAGRQLAYIRLVGRRRPNMELASYAWPDTMRSFPPQYEKKSITPQSGG
jgi:hypothetical protein